MKGIQNSCYHVCGSACKLYCDVTWYNVSSHCVRSKRYWLLLGNPECCTWYGIPVGAVCFTRSSRCAWYVCHFNWFFSVYTNLYLVVQRYHWLVGSQFRCSKYVKTLSLSLPPIWLSMHLSQFFSVSIIVQLMKCAGCLPLFDFWSRAADKPHERLP